jgi:hypothetical protein
MHGNKRDLNYDLLPMTSASVCLLTYTATLKRHLRKFNLFSSSPNSPVQTLYSLRRWDFHLQYTFNLRCCLP